MYRLWVIERNQREIKKNSDDLKRFWYIFPIFISIHIFIDLDDNQTRAQEFLWRSFSFKSTHKWLVGSLALCVDSRIKVVLLIKSV